MKFKRLLVITPAFPNRLDERVDGIFIKDQIKFIQNHFLEVNVISPRTIWNKSVFDTTNYDYSWDNVHVYYPLIPNLPSPYVPTKLKNMWLHKEARSISRLILSKDIKFDLIHAHYTWYPGAVSLELIKKFKVPLVITEHTSVTLSKALRRRDPFFINTWANCNAVISVNRATTSDIARFNRMSVHIPNGYDSKTIYPLNKRECRGKLGIDPDIKFLLSIGSLDEVKGHRYLIKAMCSIVKQRNDVLCFIAGSGPLKNALQKLIDDLGLTNHVRLIGQISRKDISTLINASDLFVLPSLKESFGIVQIEALACGKPVVATKNGGSEEIITSDEYGYLVEPENEIQLAESVLVALDREWNGCQIREYSKKYSWDQISKQIISLYETLNS